MKIIVFCLFVALTAGAQSTTEHLPVTDAEKIADALRAGPNFITDDATTVPESEVFMPLGLALRCAGIIRREGVDERAIR